MKSISINHADDPYFVAHTVFDAVQSIERMRSDSFQEAKCASIGLVDDPYGAVLEVGVYGDVGFIKFLTVDTEAWSRGIGDTRNDTRTYLFQEDDVEIPKKYEVPYEIVQLAVIDYMVHDGQQPMDATATPEYA